MTETTPVNGASTVPRDPLATLATYSDDRFREIQDACRDWNFGRRYAEAAAYAALATMENDTLRKLRLMARAQVCYAELAERLEMVQKIAHSLGEHLACKLIPEVMDNNELQDFTLAGGRKVVVEEKIHASLSKENREKGCKALEERGFGSLIKRTVSVALSTKQAKLADKIIKSIEKALGPVPSVAIEDEKAVHHGTLSKWVREQLQNGEEFSTEDMKLFGVYRQRRASITDKKGD